MRKIGIALMLLAGALAAVAGVAAASEVEGVRIQDRCDPATFNAFGQEVFGINLCVEEDGESLWGEFGPGNVTFDEFAAMLNPEDGGHGAWRFNPDDTHIDAGESIKAVNTGGEDHSFTRVLNFGLGVVPVLDSSLPPGTPPAIPAEDPGPTFLPPGGSRTVTGLSPGRHLFQCLIHPWMRTVVEVRDD